MNFMSPCAPRSRVAQYELKADCGNDAVAIDPAALAPLIAPLLPKDTYAFYDAFGKEIKPSIYPSRPESPKP